MVEEIGNMIYDVKEKLTDNEFKTIMETLRDIKLNTKLLYQISYIKTVLERDDSPDDISVRNYIQKGYAMINESDEETIRLEIEDKGAATVHHKLFNEIKGQNRSICNCCEHTHQSSVNVRVLDECEEQINYDAYFITVLRIKQIEK